MSGLRQLLDAAALGKLTSLRTLHTLAGIDARAAAEFCRVPWDTYRRYLSDRRAPPSLLQLLTVRAGRLPWPGWESFLFSAVDGRLYHDALRDGFRPQDLLSLHWLRQELEIRRRQVEQEAETWDRSERTAWAAPRATLRTDRPEGLSMTPEEGRTPPRDPARIRTSCQNRFTYTIYRQAQERTAARCARGRRAAALSDRPGISPAIHYAQSLLHPLQYWL